ncbi:phosphoribosylanthranilate isomerase [Deltaproteobacteria bacterium TL4]
MLTPCVKICGITTAEQALACIELGADWLGFNCYPKSVRYVTPEKISAIVKIIPPSVETVGVFVNESLEKVQAIMRHTGMGMVQLHGDESPQYAEAVGFNTMKAFRVKNEFELEQIKRYLNEFFLLDSYHPGLYGGTGETFNWEIAKRAKSFGQLILAGGLNSQNVAQAVQSVVPYGVDTCSGVESSPGVKDLSQVEQFIQNAKRSISS